jgi:hypothetical protein
MRAKPQLREHLLATKMKKWAMIGALPPRLSELLAFASKTKLRKAVRPTRRGCPSPRPDHHFCVSTNLRFPLEQHR